MTSSQAPCGGCKVAAALPETGSNPQRLQPAGNHMILARDLGADDVKFWVSCTGLALPNQQEGTRSCPASY